MPSTAAQSILVRGVNWLGDAVMTTPAMQRLREAMPTARITLLAPAKLAELWEGHPSIDAVLTFAEDESVLSVGKRLQANRFDLGLALPNSPRSALELWLARIPKRIGYARPLRSWMLTQAVPPRTGETRMRKRSASEVRRLIDSSAKFAPHHPPTAHHIHQYLHLVTALGGNPEPLPPLLKVSGEFMARLAERFGLAQSNPDAAPCFGLNAGAEYGPAKCWPENRFIEAAIEIHRRTKCTWLVFGVKSGKDQAARIADAISRAAHTEKTRPLTDARPAAINLAGETTLSDLCAALKLCRVLLTNDSGPMHVAAALDTPVVVPFGSTSPELTGPGLPGDFRHRLLRANVPCSPCFLRECPIDFRCMTGIPVAQVVEAVLAAAAPLAFQPGLRNT